MQVVVGANGTEAFARLLALGSTLDELARRELSEPSFELARELERPFSSVAVALDEHDTVAGFLLGWLVADELHILDVLVLPTHRRRHAGTRLVTAMLDDARMQGRRLALLEVRRRNHAARRLYRSLGFVETGLRRGYYSDDGDDAVEMACGLCEGALAAFGPPLDLEDALDEAAARDRHAAPRSS